ncbi:WD40/YVTN/BNR-like repeat-containing protein [Aquabacterium sp.]|uniref:WD40/YVTN/BNR-like repeat-containing protein n=1 Tax=Aquabacterium sp. TaxID=1872578 RepID=UPI002BBAE3A7|nr:YCF48-related protein [Aquabacterium sp.]HSW07635.1 YCF48-related protein [Aquabacterium sp.]
MQGRACSGADSGGWCWQNPLPQGNPINSYAWLDGQRGWAVGSLGTILKTSDGGQTWATQTSGTRSNLGRVIFVNDRVGWVGGDNGLLLKTADGGSTWHSVSVGVDIGTERLQAADENTAWVNTYTDAYVTTDGGSHWRRIRPPANGQSLRQIGPRTLLASSYDNGLSLLRTVDSGASWQPVPLPAVADGFVRHSMTYDFANDQFGVVQILESKWDSESQTHTTREVTFRTQDGGMTWAPLASPRPLSEFVHVEYQVTPDGAIFAHNNYSSQTIDYTTDGGITWRILPKPGGDEPYLQRYTPYSGNRVLLDRGNGRFYLTADAGANWTELPGGGSANRSITSVWFFDSREGLALMSDGNSLRTTDGGQTWVPRRPDPLCCHGWRSLEFASGAAIGWAISDAGEIYRSTDKGLTWLSPVPQSSERLGFVADYHFVDLSHGWALSWYTSTAQGNLFSSSDGGASWQAVPDSNNLAGMQSLRFADRSHGVAVGVAGVAMLTSDGGVSWQPRPTGSGSMLRKVVFVDPQTVVAVGDGGTILRSTDGGQNWTRVGSPTSASLSEVRFVSASVGHAVGTQGTLLSTSDGGLTWQDASPSTRAELAGVFFIDESTGWVVGSDGAILATVSGGR